MNLAKIFTFAIIGLFIGMGAVLAQDNEGVAGQELKDLDVQWVWGETVNVDTKNNLILLKYLDYEDSNEKDISLTVDAETSYENAKSLEELKPQDFLSIDYVITPDGRNLAKSIGLDSPREVQPEVEAGAKGEEDREAAEEESETSR